jgi:hypothetical protein
MTGSRFNIGSKIYNSTTGVEIGNILHDGTYTATTTPASADTLLIRQAGQQKQITYANLTAGLGGSLTSVKNWSGVLTLTGASVIATVNQDLLGKMIAVEITDTSGATDQTNLLFVRLNNINSWINFATVTGSSVNLVYTSYVSLARTSATQITFYQPRWTYESFSTGSPSSPSSNINNDTLYLHNIYVVEGI